MILSLVERVTTVSAGKPFLIILIEGGQGKDRIFGQNGNDRIYGDDGPGKGASLLGSDDFIRGGEGNDTIFGQRGNDEIYGDGGSDFLVGGGGNDSVLGGGGNDRLRGNAGDDVLTGGAGSDILTGGSGKDVFVFNPATDFKNSYLDVITDFDVNEDRMDFSAFNLGSEEDTNFAFDDFSNGMTQGLNSAFFQIGADTYIVARGQLGYGLGELGDNFDKTSGVKLEGVNIDDLGGFNFIFPEGD